MSDDFNARYRLLKCVAVDDGIRTHNAQELSTGRVVMVHLADAAGPDEVERLGGLLARLGGADKNRVLETATLPSGYAIVTEFIAGLTSFPTWLATKATAMPAAPAIGESRPRLEQLQATSARVPTPVAPPVIADPVDSVLPATPVAAAEVPPPAPAGDALTAMFGAADSSTQQPETTTEKGQFSDTSASLIDEINSPVAPETPPNEPATSQAHGAFTLMFGAPPTPPAPPAPPAATPVPSVAPPTDASGSFTQIFGAADVPQAAPMPPVAPPIPVPPPVAPPAPGEFTRIFSAPPTVAPMPQSIPPSLVVPPTMTPSSATPATPAPWPPVNATPVVPPIAPPPLFGGARPSTGAPTLPPPFSAAPTGPSPVAPSPLTPTPMTPPPAATNPLSAPPTVVPPPIFSQHATTAPLSPWGGAAAPASSPAGPSDFTRMISKAPTPVIPDTPVPAEKTPSTAKSGKRGIPTALIVVINAVILIAVIIVVFVLKRPVPTAPTMPTAPAAPQVSAPKQ